MRLKNNGQALIEFVLILPVFLLILFALIDFGRLFYEKIELENRFQTSIEVYQKEKNYDKALSVLNEGQGKEATLEAKQVDSYIELETSISFSFLTPGLSTVLGNPYLIKIERTIPYDEE